MYISVAGGEWQPTEDRIDYDKLREPEPILFHEHIILFEDELDDNGCSRLSVRIVRVSKLKFYSDTTNAKKDDFTI